MKKWWFLLPLDGIIVTFSSLRKKARSSYGYGGEVAKEITVAQAQVSEGLSSSVFEIKTPASVPADNSGHKVCIS